jgi:hypothetical protein
LADPFRDQPRLRLAVGTLFLLYVWVSYVLRITLGVGLIRDDKGHPAPARLYLLAAFATTAIVALWLLIQALRNRNRRN